MPASRTWGCGLLSDPPLFPLKEKTWATNNSLMIRDVALEPIFYLQRLIIIY